MKISAGASAEEEQGLWCPLVAARELAKIRAWQISRGEAVSELDEEESARGEISDEDHIDNGPWVSKGNPIGFLDSEDEEVVDQMGHDWRLRRMSRMTAGEWENVARFLLTHTVNFVDSSPHDIKSNRCIDFKTKKNFVDSELVETDEEMKEFDLWLRIPDEEGSVDGEGRQAISDAFRKLAKERDDSYQQQDDVKDKLEARDGIITGLQQRLKSLMTRKDSSELEKQLADQTHAVMLAENGIRMKRSCKLPSGRHRRQRRRQGGSGGHGRRRRHR